MIGATVKKIPMWVNQLAARYWRGDLAAKERQAAETH